MLKPLDQAGKVPFCCIASTDTAMDRSPNRIRYLVYINRLPGSHIRVLGQLKCATNHITDNARRGVWSKRAVLHARLNLVRHQNRHSAVLIM